MNRQFFMFGSSQTVNSNEAAAIPTGVNTSTLKCKLYTSLKFLKLKIVRTLSCINGNNEYVKCNAYRRSLRFFTEGVRNVLLLDYAFYDHPFMFIVFVSPVNN